MNIKAQRSYGIRLVVNQFWIQLRSQLRGDLSTLLGGQLNNLLSDRRRGQIRNHAVDKLSELK